MKGGELDPDIAKAAAYWSVCRQGRPASDDEERERWTKLMAEYNDERADQGDAPRGPITDGELTVMQLMARWLYYFADSGFVTLHASHTYAAALMASDPPEKSDLLLPWRAFRVMIPEGLVHTDGIPLRYIYVNAVAEEDRSLFARQRGLPYLCVASDRIAGPTGYGVRRFRGGDTIAEVLLERSADDWHWVGDDDAQSDAPPCDNENKERIMVMCCNYVVGLLYTIQHTQHWKDRRARHAQTVPGDRRLPPVHRNIVCGRPIQIDLRAFIREVLERPAARRRRAASMVQSLVRGHYKRQVIGVGRTGRKVVWVEPYWRGPEEAPILVRPYGIRDDDPELAPHRAAETPRDGKEERRP